MKKLLWNVILVFVTFWLTACVSTVKIKKASIPPQTAGGLKK